jgi:hypothetical protein
MGYTPEAENGSISSQTTKNIKEAQRSQRSLCAFFENFVVKFLLWRLSEPYFLKQDRILFVFSSHRCGKSTTGSGNTVNN